MARHYLHTSSEDFDFVLVGITSAENQYRMVSLVNDVLGTDLFLSDYLPLTLKDGKLFRFSLFRYVDEELRLEYYLVPNTSNFDEPFANNNEPDTDLFGALGVEESVRLVKELPKTDYLLLIKGEDLIAARYKIMERLKEISEIVQLQAIEPGELPSKRNLIF